MRSKCTTCGCDVVLLERCSVCGKRYCHIPCVARHLEDAHGVINLRDARESERIRKSYEKVGILPPRKLKR